MRIKDEKQEGIERRYVALSYITEKAAGPAAFFIFIEERLVRDPLRICCRPLPSGRCI